MCWWRRAADQEQNQLQMFDLHSKAARGFAFCSSFPENANCPLRMHFPCVLAGALASSDLASVPVTIGHPRGYGWTEVTATAFGLGPHRTWLMIGESSHVGLFLLQADNESPSQYHPTKQQCHLIATKINNCQVFAAYVSIWRRFVIKGL